jgi:diaminobutyrate-2-oxoglutarate transaminase
MAFEEEQRRQSDCVDVFAELESGVQSYARAFPRQFDVARGVHIWDRVGRRYVDFLTGAGSLNYGHNHPVLKQALLDYVARDGIAHGLDLHTAAKEGFLAAFRDLILLPRNLAYKVQFTGPTGTNAVEAALKLARLATGRTGIVSFTNAFHGVSAGALAATGNKFHRSGAGYPLAGTTVMPYEGYWGADVDTIACAERLLDDPSSGVELPAAVIVETVQGEGGLKAASPEWLRRLALLCRERDILLIVDDIQAGCGRTGPFFSFEEAGIVPDIVTLSKSLSAYGLPLAVVLIRPDLDIWKPGQHNGTFRGNNHAFVTAAAALEHFWRSDVFQNDVRENGEHLGRRLQEMADRFSPQLVEVRGRGMMQGVVCRDRGLAARARARAFENGVIVECSGPYDEVVKCLPPLTITRAEFDEGLDALEQAFEVEARPAAPVRQLRASG